MNAVVLDGIPNLPDIFVVLVNVINPVHFFSLCYNAIEWFYKTWQVYYPKTEMVQDGHFLRSDVNDS